MWMFIAWIITIVIAYKLGHSIGLDKGQTNRRRRQQK